MLGDLFQHTQIGVNSKSNWCNFGQFHLLSMGLWENRVVTSYVASADGPDDVHIKYFYRRPSGSVHFLSQ